MADVLVVDDDAATREVVRMVLEDAGHTVWEAADGEAGLAFMRASGRPLVVVLDDMMPNLSGLEVLGILASEPAAAARHAYILMTGSARIFSPGATPEQAGMTIYLVPKPFDVQELLDMVERARQALPGT